MRKRVARLGWLLALLLQMTIAAGAGSVDDAQAGLRRVKSVFPMAETVARIKHDLAAKGIKFFTEIDQAKLAAGAGIDLRPSILLIFGNPPLGAQFLTSNADAGLDWPVRLLVRQDADGSVWAVYGDFAWIAHRYGIADRPAQFAKASEVIVSITGSIAGK